MPVVAWVMTSAACAAAAWGISDFLAGLLARRLPIVTILVWSKVAAMLLAVVAAAVWTTPPATGPRLWLGVLAGLVGLPAMGLLYRAMRDGSLAVVAPVAAIAALVPVAWGLLHGDRLSLFATLGIAAGLAGATLASWPVPGTPQRRTQHSANLCALGAALGFGIYFVLLHEAATADQFWSVAYARITEGLAALLFLLTTARRRSPTRKPSEASAATPTSRNSALFTSAPDRAAVHSSRTTRLGLGARSAIPIFIVGATDALADAAFITAAAAALAPAAVVASLYPAVTLMLNRSLLRERLHTVHLYGVLAALFAVACLAR
ncbi:EamA family transporter [Paractinoplanes lichenicola]|uniref:EamA family transporter n=1 Tax=Paractinoplanes lichenicola TaxID=2802976 RepID=UPI001F46AAF6|nr:EamA family transporter [Actinoplanes lichenicola]